MRKHGISQHFWMTKKLAIITLPLQPQGNGNGNGNGVALKSEAQFNVKFLFINAYSYSHKSDETWQGDCLQTITSSTDDNGEQYNVSGSVAG